MTANQARKVSVEKVLEKMTDAHRDQYDLIQERIESMSNEGGFSTYHDGGLFPDVGELLEAQGYNVMSHPAKSGYNISWLR